MFTETLTPSTAYTRKNRLAQYATTVTRILLGLSFFVFGLNGFLHFIPQPDAGTMPEAAVAFSNALVASGYMLKLIAVTQVVVGALLLSNRCVPLALALLAPVMVNIVLFHVFLLPSGIGLALVLLALQLALAWIHRDAYLPMLRARAGQ